MMEKNVYNILYTVMCFDKTGLRFDLNELIKAVWRIYAAVK